MNPILQALNNRPNNMQSLIQAAKGNPQAVFNSMMNSNPRFAQFVRDSQGKSPDQIAMEHGIDPSVLRNFMK